MNAFAPGALEYGGCSSNTVIDSALFASGDFDIGPGAGYM